MIGSNRARAFLSPVAFAILLLAPGALRAQDPPPPPVPAQSDTIYQVKLRDGSMLFGRIASQSGSQLVLLTSGGIRMEIPLANVQSVEVARGRLVGNEYWSPDPNKTRLFFAPTARAVGSGEGYVGTYFIVLPFVAFGIGDHITLSGGAPILFGQIEPFYIAPKITFVETGKVALAAGAISVWSTDNSFEEGFGIAFGMATLGTPDHALTAGIGFGFAGTDVSGQPAFMLGGESRIGKHSKLITENYFVAGETGALLSGGVRVLAERLSVDVGLMSFVGGGESACCFPMLSFAYAFGKGH